MLIETALQLVAPILLELVIRDVAGPAIKQFTTGLSARAERRASPAAVLPIESSPEPRLRTVASVDIVSLTPGRLRVAVAGLRGQPQLAEDLAGELGSLPGVDRADPNPRTGRLLIEFDPARQDAGALVSALEQARIRQLAPAKGAVGCRSTRSARHLAAVI